MSHDMLESVQLDNEKSQAETLPQRPTRTPILPEHDVDQTSKVMSEQEHIVRLVNGIEDALETMLVSVPTPIEMEENVDDHADTLSTQVMNVSKKVFQLFNPTTANRFFDREEQAQLQKQLKLEMTYAECAYLLKFMKRIKRTIVVMASKGGAGKTPLITNLAVLHAWLAAVSNLLIEGNENDGTVNLRLGLRRREQSLLNNVLADHDLISEHDIACEKLGKHKQTSVYALLSDENATNNKFTMEEFLAMYQVLRPKFRNGFGDTGNGNSHAANEGLFLEADIVLFPAVADDNATFSTLLSTMINLYKLGHKEKLQKHSFVVINGTHERDSIEKFLKRFYAVAVELVAPHINHKTNEQALPYWTDSPVQLMRDLGFDYDETQERFTGKKIYMVPYSQWIRDGKPASVLPEETGLETLVAYAQILVDCFKQEAPSLEAKKLHINRRIAERQEQPTLEATVTTAETVALQQLTRALENNSSLSPELKQQVEDVARAIAGRELQRMLNPAS